MGRLVQRYRYNPHRLGALSESRSAAQLKKLAEKGDVILLHVNERVNQGGADLIWYDIKNDCIVFADVKASVSGSTISRVNTFEQRMRKNVDTALDIITNSPTLTQAEKDRLLEALENGKFDVQVIFAGNAKGSTTIFQKLKASIQREYPQARVREPMRLDLREE